MRPGQRWLAACTTTIALAAAVGGCGAQGKPPVNSSTTEAKVTGKVTVKGVLAKKGVVTFNPANYLRKTEAARDAPIRPDGTYEITTLVGENSVSVGGTGLPGETAYGFWTYDVKGGTNTYDIEVPHASSP